MDGAGRDILLGRAAGREDQQGEGSDKDAETGRSEEQVTGYHEDLYGAVFLLICGPAAGPGRGLDKLDRDGGKNLIPSGRISAKTGLWGTIKDQKRKG
jgi:hypothetical protein